MKATKKTKKLPERGALKELVQSPRTLADYAKASPLDVLETIPISTIRQLATLKRRKNA